jgi:hypothetical protein
MFPLTKQRSDRIGSMGAVTLFLRGVHEDDRVAAAAHRRANKQFKLNESARLQADRMANYDKASETQLAMTTQSLTDEILSLWHLKRGPTSVPERTVLSAPVTT